MNHLQEKKENHLNVHFLKWKNFKKYIAELHNNNIEKIYLSSTCTDPLLYKYLDELIDYLKKENFKVGFRSNGCLSIEKYSIIKIFNGSISFSLNSFNKNTNKIITGSEYIPDYDKLLKSLEKDKKKCRISIVINKYNYKEIPEMIDRLSKYSNSIAYIQLRKIYKYYNKLKEEEIDSYEYVKNWLLKEAKYKKMYYESKVYEYKGIEISLWENVFDIKNIQSINYFTNGLISNYNLLIPIYEENKNES